MRDSAGPQQSLERRGHRRTREEAARREQRHRRISDREEQKGAGREEHAEERLDVRERQGDAVERAAAGDGGDDGRKGWQRPDDGLGTDPSEGKECARSRTRIRPGRIQGSTWPSLQAGVNADVHS